MYRHHLKILKMNNKKARIPTIFFGNFFRSQSEAEKLASSDKYIKYVKKLTCISSAIFMVICDSPFDITHVPSQSYKN